MGNVIDAFLFQPPEPSRLKKSKIFWLDTSTGTRIPAFHIEYGCEGRKRSPPRVSNSTTPITLLYSHANAEDLGCIYPWCKYLSKHLGVNVLAYDYTGYGLAMEEGPATEEQCYADIDAAYAYLRRTLQIPASQIVLYGRSVGTGPSCYLACRTSESSKEDTIGGLILHAPFLSIYRIIFESGCTLVGDRFPNCDFIAAVEAPILLIHGKKDKVIPIAHSEALFQTIQRKYRAPPLFVDRMGHNNVQLSMRHLFLNHLNAYMERYIRSNCPNSYTKPVPRILQQPKKQQQGYVPDLCAQSSSFSVSSRSSQYSSAC